MVMDLDLEVDQKEVASQLTVYPILLQRCIQKNNKSLFIYYKNKIIKYKTLTLTCMFQLRTFTDTIDKNLGNKVKDIIIGEKNDKKR